MKRLSSIYLIVLSVVTLFTSCKKEHVIPSFPEELAEYFPYEEGESFTFISEDGDSLTFIVRYKNLSIGNTHIKPSFASCGDQDYAYMKMDAYIDTNATSLHYIENKKVAMDIEMYASPSQPKSDGSLEMSFCIRNASKYNGFVHVSYCRRFECDPFENDAISLAGENVVFYEYGYEDWSDLRAEATYDKGIISFDFDGKKWIAQ